MNASLGEVIQAAGMIEVQVGEDDVANIAGREAQRLDLSNGSELLAKIGIEET